MIDIKEENLSIAKRIKDFRNHFGLSQTSFSKRLGWPVNRIKNMEAGNQTLNISLLGDFQAEVFKAFGVWVRDEWIKTGYGDMTDGGERQKSDAASKEKILHHAHELITTTYYEDISASAGHGEEGNGYSVTEELGLSERFFNLTGEGTPQGSLTTIRIKGYSMEPLMHHNDLVMVEKYDHRWIDGRVYVVRLGEDIFIKQIQWIKTQNKYKMISVNPEYEPQSITGADLEDFQIIGRVVMKISGM